MSADVRVEISASAPQCRRCDGEGILTVEFPHRWANGDESTGIRRWVLCQRCDAKDPDATGLLAMFTVYEQVTEENVAECGAMLQRFVDSVTNRRVPPEVQAEEEAQFLRGEL
ncbi:DUF6300 family protein [Kitasatospora sp. NPDC001574]